MENNEVMEVVEGVKNMEIDNATLLKGLVITGLAIGTVVLTVKGVKYLKTKKENGERIALPWKKTHSTEKVKEVAEEKEQ